MIKKKIVTRILCLEAGVQKGTDLFMRVDKAAVASLPIA